MLAGLLAGLLTGRLAGLPAGLLVGLLVGLLAGLPAFGYRGEVGDVRLARVFRGRGYDRFARVLEGGGMSDSPR